MTAEEGLRERISAVVRLYGGRAAAARAAGISPDQLSRYVQGRSSPGFETLARMAAGSGISLDWLWSGSGSMFLADRAELPASSPLPASLTSKAQPSPNQAEPTAPTDPITPELVRLVALYWLTANTLLETPRLPEDLARLIAGQCDAMRGEEKAADHFVRHLTECTGRHGGAAGKPAGLERRGGSHGGPQGRSRGGPRGR